MDIAARPSDPAVPPLSDDEYDADGLRVDLAGTADGTVRLSLTGEFDCTTTGRLLRCVVEALHDPGPARLEIAARELVFIDSSGIRCLLVCSEYAAAAGSRLIVTDPSPIVYQVLEITGLLNAFGIPSRSGSESAAGSTIRRRR